MIQIGDQVRHWIRGYMGLSEDDWMMYGGGSGPLTVVLYGCRRRR